MKKEDKITMLTGAILEDLSSPFPASWRGFSHLFEMLNKKSVTHAWTEV